MIRFILLISLAITSALQAQITLTRENSFPEAGDSFTYYGSSDYSPAEISSEQGVVWDFTEAENTSVPFEISYVSPGEDEFSGMFPEHHIVALNSMWGLDLRLYYHTSDSAVKEVGSYQPSLALSYTDPFLERTYPTSVGTTYSDDFTSIDLSDESIYQTGFFSSEVTNQGTLILPGGIETAAIKLTKNVNWNISDGLNSTSTINFWYDGINRTYLAREFKTFLDKKAVFTRFEYLSSENFNSLTVEELNDKNFAIFPNPSEGKITIRLTNNTVNHSNIYIRDLQGKLIMKKEINTLSDEITTLEGLESGTYFIQLQSPNSISTQKLLVH